LAYILSLADHTSELDDQFTDCPLSRSVAVVTIRYRADIDGLRAVAVVAVIFYHFGVPGFSGGFVGVDVFFVVSGFLIASLIDSEIREGRFTLVHFFERRIRRIFPALVVLLLVVSILAYFELFPHTYKAFGRSITATSFLLSNVEFWREGAVYFAPPSTQKPLLHTWSLAVEEQFYLLFPALLMLLARYPRQRTIVTLQGIILASLSLSIWSSSALAQAGFFLFPSRIWELLLGALIAVRAVPTVTSGKASDLLSALGVAMILWSVVFFTTDTPFPGIAALVPCVGTGLIIFAGLDDEPAVSRMLRIRPLVFFGLISYSLYLWHWPLYVFATYHLDRSLSAAESAGVIAVSIAIAACSWRYVEQPFRRPSGLASRRHVFLQAAAATSIFAISGIAIYIWNGFPQRYSPDVQAVLAPKMDRPSTGCDSGQGEQTIFGLTCKVGRLDPPATFLVWGDSHADVLVPGIARAASLIGYSGLVVVSGACPPLLDYVVGRQCRQRNDAMLHFIQMRQFNTVILGAHWTAYAERTYFDRGELRSLRYGQDSESAELSFEESRRAFARSLNRTVTALHANGLRVIIIGQIPEVGVDVPMTLARNRMRGLSEDLGPTLAQFEARNRFVLDTFRSLDGMADFIYPHRMLCPKLRCAVMLNGRPLYLDGTHLTRFGAESISAIFEPVFSGGH
jgi:peptidoglycan/LPS O-acetylase OafA/YrhL